MIYKLFRDPKLESIRTLSKDILKNHKKNLSEIKKEIKELKLQKKTDDNEGNLNALYDKENECKKQIGEFLGFEIDAKIRRALRFFFFEY